MPGLGRKSGPGLAILIGSAKRPGDEGSGSGPSGRAMALARDFMAAKEDEEKLARVFDSLPGMRGREDS